MVQRNEKVELNTHFVVGGVSGEAARISKHVFPVSSRLVPRWQQLAQLNQEKGCYLGLHPPAFEGTPRGGKENQ